MNWIVTFGALLKRDTRDLARHIGVVAGNMIVPLVFLLVASAGFSDAFGRALGDPYDTYVTFAEYLTPGLANLVLFVAVTRSMLAMLEGPGAADMRLLTSSPLPSWFVVLGKIVTASVLATFQAGLFIALSPIAGAGVDFVGWLLALPGLLLVAMMLSAVSLSLLVVAPRLRSFSAMMLLIVWPGFLVSSALYPLWKFTDFGADYLNVIAEANPFTHAVELIRYASEGQLEPVSLLVVVGVGAAAFLGVMAALSPRFGLLTRRPRPGAWAEPATE